MPAAPNLKTLFKISSAVEKGMKAVFAAQTPPIQGYTQRETANLPVPRVDIMLEVGAATGHRGLDRQRKPRFDAWNYRMTIGVVTDRNKDQQEFHEDLVAEIRIISQYASDLLNDRAKFPYHVLTSIVEGGTTPTVSTSDDCDVSEITFTGIVSIHKDAWPLG